MAEGFSPFGDLDFSSMMLGLAFAQSPVLRPLAPLMFQAGVQRTKNKQTAALVQGLGQVHQFMQAGNYDQAEQTLVGLGKSAPAGSAEAIQEAYKLLGEKRQQANFVNSLIQANPSLEQYRPILNQLNPPQALDVAKGQTFQYQGTILGYDPLTQKSGKATPIPQFTQPDEFAKSRETLHQQGVTTADLANAYSQAVAAGDQATVEKLRPIIQALPGGQAQFERGEALKTLTGQEKIRQQFDIGTAQAKAGIQLGMMGKETEELVKRAAQTATAQFQGKTAAEMVAPLEFVDKTKVAYDTQTRARAAPFAVTPQQIIGSGGKLVALEQKDFSLVGDMAGAEKNIDRTLEIAQKLLTDKPGANLFQAVELAVKRKLASSEDLASLDAIQATLLGVARLIQRDSRISENDYKIISGFKISDIDTQTTARAKIRELKMALRRSEEALTGVPLPDLTKPTRKQKVTVPGIGEIEVDVK